MLILLLNLKLPQSGLGYLLPPKVRALKRRVSELLALLNYLIEHHLLLCLGLDFGEFSSCFVYLLVYGLVVDGEGDFVDGGGVP